MPRQKINRISAIVPFVMSLLAFFLVLVAVTTGWDQGTKDEGSAAHIFHLLIALQIPFILAFLLTADWKWFMRLAGIVTLQATAVALAFGPVALTVTAACNTVNGMTEKVFYRSSNEDQWYLV